MSIKSKILATAATLALVGGVGTAGVLGTAVPASAATPSCGSECVNTYPEEFAGTELSAPDFVLDVYQQKEKIGQPVILFRSSLADRAEDFTYADEGTVSSFFAAGLVDSSVELHYGCTGGTPILIDGTSATCSPGAVDDIAFQLEYAPDGVDSGLCVAVAATAGDGEGVTLQDCGVTAKSVWIQDTYSGDYAPAPAPAPIPFPAGTPSSPSATPGVSGYAALINGSDTDFSQPYVLTYPANGYPTDKPRPELETENLQQYSNGTPADDTAQLFAQFTGPLP